MKYKFYIVGETLYRLNEITGEAWKACCGEWQKIKESK